MPQAHIVVGESNHGLPGNPEGHHENLRSQLEEHKYNQDLIVEGFNRSLGPDFKIYEFDDFLVNFPDDEPSSPSSPPTPSTPAPPLPPRYSACFSVPPPVSRRTRYD